MPAAADAAEQEGSSGEPSHHHHLLDHDHEDQRRMSGPALGPRDPAPPPDHPVGLGEDSGPNPVVRAIVGLLVGLGAGALAASLTPRPERAKRTPPAGG